MESQEAVGGGAGERWVGVGGGSDGRCGRSVDEVVGWWIFRGGCWVAEERDGWISKGILDWREVRDGLADGVDDRLGLGVVVLGWPDCNC